LVEGQEYDARRDGVRVERTRRCLRDDVFFAAAGLDEFDDARIELRARRRARR
jgi:hypothetical protein